MTVRNIVLAGLASAWLVSLPAAAQPAGSPPSVTPSGTQPAVPTVRPAIPDPGARGAMRGAMGGMSQYAGLGILTAIAVGGFGAASNGAGPSGTGTGTR